MCCTATARVNDVGEKTSYKYGEIEIEMSIYMDDISVAGGPQEDKQEIRKCVQMEIEKKKKNTLTLIWVGFSEVCFEERGGVKLPHLKLIRIMLETSNLART